MKSLDLSQECLQNKPKMPPIVKPREIKNIPGVRGVMPLRAGEVVLTPDELARLRAIGWKPGDPIPGNLPEYLKAFNLASKQLPDEIKNEILTTSPVPPGTPATRIAPPIDISALEPEKRAEIEKYLADFRKQVPQIEAAMKVRSQVNKATPSVQKAIVTAEEEEGVELIDSRDVMAEDFQRKIDIAEGKVSTDEGNEEVKPTEPDVDYIDKVNYLTAIMALEPFKKTYSLYGGRIKLTFKQPSINQISEAIRQVRIRAQSGIVSADECVKQGNLYIALLSLDSISFNGEEINTAEIRERLIREIQRQPDSNYMAEWIIDGMRNTAPLNNLAIWKAIQTYNFKFVELVELLEAKADNADFWQGIEV